MLITKNAAKITVGTLVLYPNYSIKVLGAKFWQTIRKTGPPNVFWLVFSGWEVSRIIGKSGKLGKCKFRKYLFLVLYKIINNYNYLYFLTGSW